MAESVRYPANSGHQTVAGSVAGLGTRGGPSSTPEMLREGVHGHSGMETKQHDPRLVSSALSQTSSYDAPDDGMEKFEDKELTASAQDMETGTRDAGSSARSDRDNAAGPSPASPRLDGLDGAPEGQTALSDEEGSHRIVTRCHQARAGNAQEWSTQERPVGGNHEFHVAETKEAQVKADSSTHGQQRGYPTAFDGVESSEMQLSSNQLVVPEDCAMHSTMGTRQEATCPSSRARLQHDRHQRATDERPKFSATAAPWPNRHEAAATFPYASRHPDSRAGVSDSSPGMMTSAYLFAKERLPGWGKGRDEKLGREGLIGLVSVAVPRLLVNIAGEFMRQ